MKRPINRWRTTHGPRGIYQSSRWLALAAAVLTISLAAPAAAKVFHSKEGALKLAFPTADKVKAQHIFLTDAQTSRLTQITGQRPRSKLVTVYVGRRAGRVLGYAIIDTHVVRTLPETFMTVLDPSGHISAVHILAFHEPQEYLPRSRWLGQFKHKHFHSDLRLRRGIAGIAGATLSSRAVTAGVKRVLALFEVALRRADASRVHAQR